MKKILYVEDDALVARLYSQKLVEAGFDVVVAEDGLAAVKWLAEFTPDLIVLDLLMPKMTGADVLKFMRDRPELSSVRVVVFSNSFLSNLTEQVALSNVETTLVKSAVTPAKLIDTVREVLEAPSRFPARPAADSSLKPSAPGPNDSMTLAPPPRSPAPVLSKESDGEFRVRVQKEFFERTPEILKSVRELCREFLEAADNPAQQKRRLEDLTRKIGFVTQMTAMAGCHRLAQLSSALEALLFELHDKPALLNDSSRHTVVFTVAFLADRLDLIENPEGDRPLPASVLVVDDDAVSNRVVVLALSRAKLQATSMANPFDALKKLEQTPFDLVLLDIDMPGMNGITLFEKMRALPLHKRTPALYVTSLTDFKTRARSILSGGNDLITKPILPLELTVKAITQLLRSQPPKKPSAAAIKQ